MTMTPSCSVRRDGSENVSYTLKGHFLNLTSGQVMLRSGPSSYSRTNTQSDTLRHRESMTQSVT